MNSYQFLPPLSEEEYEALKADIANRGVLVPIEYDEQGNILDGHHRVRACQELGIKEWPSVIRLNMSENEKKEHVLLLNLNRRQITKEQKKQIALNLRKEDQEYWTQERLARVLGVSQPTIANWLSELGDPKKEEIARKKEEALKLREAGLTQQEVAERIGMTRQVISKWEKMPAMNIKNDIRCIPKSSVTPKKPYVIVDRPQDVKQVVDATKVISPDRLPQKRLEFKRLTRIVREEQAKQKAKELQNTHQPNNLIIIKNCKFQDLDIEPNSVDLIFTDPPYTKEFLPQWEELAYFASRVLRSGKLMIAYCGTLWLPEVFRMLMSHLEYVWLGAIVLPGFHSQIYPKHIRQSVKPLLFFSKGEYKPGPWFSDSAYSESRSKDHHDWEQSLGPALYYIETLTKPGDLVVDPCSPCG